MSDFKFAPKQENKNFPTGEKFSPADLTRRSIPAPIWASNGLLLADLFRSVEG